MNRSQRPDPSDLAGIAAHGSASQRAEAGTTDGPLVAAIRVALAELRRGRVDLATAQLEAALPERAEEIREVDISRMPCLGVMRIDAHDEADEAPPRKARPA